MQLKRRHFLTLIAASGASALCSRSAWSESDAPIELKWSDLIPGGVESGSTTLFEIVQHGADVSGPSSELVSDYNGKRISLPGYMLPLEFHPEGVRDFLLVPYIGACMHVPPPPPNQIVIVTSEKPYPTNNYFDAVVVTGVLDHFTEEADLPDTGYKIVADNVSAYEG